MHVYKCLTEELKNKHVWCKEKYVGENTQFYVLSKFVGISFDQNNINDIT